MAGKPLILISNDDGYQAQGIRVLTDLMTRLGDVVVVAPDAPRSGAACAITPFQPVRLSLVEERAGLRVYSCSGSPVDCVKLASEQVVTRRPDLMVSGINHGDNASISMHYSGTVGAVLEACMKDIPAVAFSLRTRDQQCDFSPYEEVILQVARQVLEYGLPSDTCLNVNFPQVPKLLGTSSRQSPRGHQDQSATPRFRVACHTAR
ncbi:MAG: 5'/3'-nucleotidase SurE [Bacteroidaceae bacterium]|nr:5'/3'-nucleotidase SurE [Bacteroidaceae bacterium]